MGFLQEALGPRVLAGFDKVRFVVFHILNSILQRFEEVGRVRPVFFIFN